MLGFIVSDERDDANARMADFAMALMADGWHLAGVVQTNLSSDKDCVGEVVLSVLGHLGPVIRISQQLGPEAKGCRLDADGLERAVAQVARTLNGKTDLLIINKFGKQEALGRGFRQVIADALAEDIPVLLTVPSSYVADFTEFVGEAAQQLEWSEIDKWARGILSAAA